MAYTLTLGAREAVIASTIVAAIWNASLTVGRQSPDSDTVISRTAPVESTGVSFVTEVWRHCNVGYFGNGSKVTENKILVSTKPPEDKTTKCVRSVR